MVSRVKILAILSVLLFTSGLVAATANDITLDDAVIQSGDTIKVNSTADQTTDDVYVVLDNNSNGNYDASTDLLTSGSISSAGSSEHIGYFNGTNTSSISEGTYTVYAVQQGSSPSDGETVSGQASTQVEFDNTAPNITDFRLDKVNFYSLNLSFESNEMLTQADLSLNDSTFFSLSDLNKNSSSSPVKYWLTTNTMTDGVLEGTLDSARDNASNRISGTPNDTVVLDPMIRDFQIFQNGDFPAVNITSDHQLTDINASLGGAATGYLGYSDFSET